MMRKPCKSCNKSQAVRPGGLCNRCFGAEKQVQTTESIPLSQIRLDGGTQARLSLDSEAVARYADAIDDCETLPPAVVYRDGESVWMADGFHRHAAHAKLDRESMDCIVMPGGQREALLHAIGANHAHGLPRTVADKRKAVAMLLADAEWGARSNEWIATAAKVSWSLVAGVRSGLAAHQPELQPETRVGRDGVARPAAMPPRQEESAEPVPEPPAETPEPDMSADEICPIDAVGQLDGIGVPVDDRLAPVFKMAPAFQDAIGHLNAARRFLVQVKAELAGAHLSALSQATIADIDNAKRAIVGAIPHTVCPLCQGAGVECKTCKRSGFITKDQFERLDTGRQKWCRERRAA